jgi:uncharacterized repeat protein (TIGR02543 family)
MKLLGSGLAAALGLLCILASCENPSTPKPKPGPGPSVENYTVKFQNEEGGTVFADKTVRKGTVLHVGSSDYRPPKQAGSLFNGWYLKGDKEQTPLNSITVNGNITLVAIWIKPFTVTLEMGEGGTLEGTPNLSFSPGQLFETQVYRPFRKGLIFLYWYVKDDPSMARVASFRVVKDITLVAKWEEGWAVTLELNGGVCDRDYITVAKTVNATVSLAGIKPVKNNNVFEGWYYNAGFTNPVSGDTIPVTGDITLYVKWLPLSEFAPLLGVWTAGSSGPSYLLYLEDSRLFGIYFSLDEIRFFAWTASILDGKEYSSAPAPRTLTVGTGEDANTFTLVTQKKQPAGNIPLSGTWIKGDAKHEVWVPSLREGEEGKWVVIYYSEKGMWLYLYEDGSGYLRADGRCLDISYVVSGVNVELLRQNVIKNDKGQVVSYEEGEVLLRIPIAGGKPSGFEAYSLLPF